MEATLLQEFERPSKHTNSLPQTLEFNQPAKIANEMAFTRQQMSEAELKVWLLMMAALSRNKTISEREVFSFDMKELAKRLGLYASRQAWKTKMRAIFDEMISQTIRIMKRDSDDEDLQHWVRLPLYSCLEYDGLSEKAYFDINDLSNVTVKCDPDSILELEDHYDWIGKPYNGNAKYWIGIDAYRADDETLKQLIRASYEIVKEDHNTKKAHNKRIRNEVRNGVPDTHRQD